ncbi:hypothetical protein E2C01_093407 [Portunus trituberculatus]|uniref:Uncharacterized protein n=1 Tax=Portunus trituberculatus TaxID=210409 RepID=A0A5B7JY73_PORTR|nr:hypothetical protein [Portunus trituberculatus]
MERGMRYKAVLTFAVHLSCTLKKRESKHGQIEVRPSPRPSPAAASPHTCRRVAPRTPQLIRSLWRREHLSGGCCGDEGEGRGMSE